MRNMKKEGTVSFQGLTRAFAVGLLLIGGWAATNCNQAWGQQELNRKVKSRVVPTYPDVAQRMRIAGVVRILVTVSPNGSVKDTRLMGGHPLLANAALDALKKWRFEPGPEEAGIVEFRFDPSR
jgi:TonB family protein